jgi:hypothetical protein
MVYLYRYQQNRFPMKTLLILFALFTHALAAQTVPNYVPSNGLVGRWPFNGNATDLSGYQNGVFHIETAQEQRTFRAVKQE